MAWTAWILAGICALGVAARAEQGVNTEDAELARLIDGLLARHRASIEANRTVEVTFRATPGAAVRVRQARHAFPFGTAINRHGFVPNNRIGPADQERYRQTVRANFNSVVHENAMKWYANERRRGEVTFADADRMLDWAETHGLHTRGHCVFWADEDKVQPWVRALDDDALRAALRQRARDYMEHFRGRVPEHDVKNEMLHHSYFSDRLGPDTRRQIFAWCRAHDPEAILYVNDYNILAGGQTERYVEQIAGFLAAGMPVGGIGVQGHFGGRIDGDEVWRKLDLLAQFGLPIKVTEFDANTPDETAKATVLATLYITAFAHPAVEGITMWGFWENRHWRPDAALWRADWTKTPAARVYRDLVFNRWWTDEDAVADADGLVRLRLFHGEHDVTVNGHTHRIAVGRESGATVIDLPAAAP